MAKLNQILAVERNVKGKNESEYSRVLQAAHSPDRVNGFFKQYAPKKDGDEIFPPEAKKVQVRVDDAIKRVQSLLAELFDVEAQKDWANCSARADIVVDGKPLLENVPATYLLYLEKKLTGVGEFVAKLQVLDPSETWDKDTNVGLFVTKAQLTYKTKKVERTDVVVQATDKFPAQIKDRVEDVIVGTWSTVKQSGALHIDRIEAISAKLVKVQRAVKYAREAANMAEAPTVSAGDPILGYIFGS